MQAIINRDIEFSSAAGNGVLEVEVPAAIEARHSLFGRVHIDGVCPFCGHWHSLAMPNGQPICRTLGTTPCHCFQRTGGMQ